jgi:hypothetical protein
MGAISMTALDAFFLGAMTAWMPSLLVMAWLIRSAEVEPI